MSDEELAALARRFAALLEDEQGRGMLAWRVAVHRVGNELQNELEDRFGKLL